MHEDLSLPVQAPGNDPSLAPVFEVALGERWGLWLHGYVVHDEAPFLIAYVKGFRHEPRDPWLARAVFKAAGRQRLDEHEAMASALETVRRRLGPPEPGTVTRLLMGLLKR